MSKDARQLREEAAEANAAGKHKRALAAYLELERVESRDAQWAKRAAETYRKLGRDDEAIKAYARSAERYAQNGFLVQAIAICKMILQIDPRHAETTKRLAQMNEEFGAGPSRAGSMAENKVELHDNPNVQALRRPTSMSSGPMMPISIAMPRTPTPQRKKPKSSAPPVVARTKSKPIVVEPDAPIDSVELNKVVPDSVHSSPGVHVIPIDDEITGEYEEPVITVEPTRASLPDIEVAGADVDMDADEIDEATELDVEDLEEIPLAQPKILTDAARKTLAQTPLFAGLPAEALEALVENLELLSLDRGDVLFREGEPSDALYVVVEGEISVQNEGPPRVEMARLGPTSFIGEVALITDQPRTATVVVAMPSELLRVDRGTLSRVLANHGSMLGAVLRFVRERLVERWMRTSPLFRPFDEAARSELAGKFRFLEIEPGTTLLGAGMKPDGLYIVLAGSFAVRRAGVVVAQLGPGDLIGETALLAGGAFRSDVIARNKSLALCLPAADFREVIMTHPHVLEYVGEQAEQARKLQIL